MARNFKPARLSDEDRAQRRREEQELTERAVAQLRSSEGWQRWLKVRSQTGCRRYSLHNQLLICLQDEHATHVAGFRAWLALGWCVRRGETSHIRVWAPCPPSRKKLQAWRDAGANPADRPRTYFRLEAVFCAAQVEPLPPPAVPVPLDPPAVVEVTGDSLVWAIPVLEQLARELGYTVVYRSLPRGHGGSCNYTTRVITINTDQAINAQVDVACHEIAHALTREDHQAEDPDLDYAAAELVAESVAKLAVGYLGLDTSGSAVPYLAGWAEAADPATFQRIAELVDRLATRLEDAFGASQNPQAPDTADQADVRACTGAVS
jgi:antirestriction protein ArdC